VRPIQEHIAGGIDGLDTSGSQGVGEKRCHVNRHEKGSAAQGSQLMDDGPKSLRA